MPARQKKPASRKSPARKTAARKTTARKAATGKTVARERSSWKGNFSFGLVTFSVEAFNALDRRESDIHFHLLHSKCHRRIQYQKICPEHGVVDKDEIVSGFELGKGKYAPIDPEELSALRTQRERALTIDAFVTPEAIDPIYFDGRMYYLLPVGSNAEESYAVIAGAMAHESRFGIGRVVFSGKDQIVLVRPVKGILHMAMLNYDAEIRRPEKMVPEIKVSTNSRQARLAQTLVREWSDDSFDFSKYEDSYREKVAELIDAKVKGHELVAPEEDDEPVTINLMDALKKSLGQSRSKASTVKTRKRLA